MPKNVVNKIEVQAKTGLSLLYSYLILLVVNAVVIYISNQLFPTDVVLGTFYISLPWAILHSMGILTLIAVFTMPFVMYAEWKRGKDFTPKEWMIWYFVINTAAVWLITRFAENFGFGISHWWVAVLLGAAFDWAQGLAMMAFGKTQAR